MDYPDYTKTAPPWQVFSYNYTCESSQLILPDNEEEAYKVYDIVKTTYDKYCIHLLIQNGLVIRQFIT